MMRHEATGPRWRGPTEWILGIVGGIAALLGLVIMFAGEETSIGIGGDLSWRVGEIPGGWGYGLLIGGGLLVLMAIGLVLFAPRDTQPQVRAGGRRDLLFHAVAFALVNAALWVQDIAIGGGVDYAYWVTLPWGIGLAAHALATFTGERRREPPSDALRR